MIKSSLGNKQLELHTHTAEDMIAMAWQMLLGKFEGACAVPVGDTQQGR